MQARDNGITVVRAARALGCPLDSPVLVYLLSLAPSSRASQLSAVRHAAAAFGVPVDRVHWPTVDHDQMSVLRAALAERFAPATANRVLAVVRSILRVCVRRGDMSREAYERAVDVRPVKGRRLPAGRALERSELERLFTHLRQRGDVHATRNGALFALAYGCGLRRAELVGLTLADLDVHGAKLRVIGKGNAEREVPLPAGTVAAVRRWLELRGDAPGFLLCVLRDGAPVPERGLHPTYVYQLAGELAAAVGLAPFSPHDLRRTYAGDLMDAGADMRTVQGLLGHASINTTARYDRRGARAAAAAAALLRVPC